MNARLSIHLGEFDGWCGLIPSDVRSLESLRFYLLLPTAELLEAQRLLNELQDLVDGRHPAVFGSFDVAFRDVVRKCREEFEERHENLHKIVEERTARLREEALAKATKVTVKTEESEEPGRV